MTNMTVKRSSPRARLFALSAALCLLTAGALAAAAPALAQGNKPKTAAAKGPTLSREEITARLAGIPLFTFADEKGAPLTASNSKGKPVVGVFVNPADAQEFQKALEKNNKDVAAKVKLVPISLGDVYRLSETQQDIQFAFVPSGKEVQAAKSLVDKFEGTPLFLGRVGKDKGYLTVTQGGRTVVPLFFEKNAIDALMGTLKTAQPDLAKTVTVEATSLENVLNLMKVGDSPDLERLEFVPVRSSLEFVRTLAGSNKPAPEPKKAPVAGPQKPPAKGTKGKS